MPRGCISRSVAPATMSSALRRSQLSCSYTSCLISHPSPGAIPGEPVPADGISLRRRTGRVEEGADEPCEMPYTLCDRDGLPARSHCAGSQGPSGLTLVAVAEFTAERTPRRGTLCT
jgi:hypothetical protein